MNRSRDKKARSQKIQEKHRVKRNESRKKNAQIRQEKLNHRVNVVEAKKVEFFNKWIQQVAQDFESTHAKK